jgi:hypothetical protein
MSRVPYEELCKQIAEQDTQLKQAWQHIAELEAMDKETTAALVEQVEYTDQLEAKLEAVRQVSRYPSGAFGEAPSGEYASEDGEFMFSEDVLAALEDVDA